MGLTYSPKKRWESINNIYPIINSVLIGMLIPYYSEQGAVVKEIKIKKVSQNLKTFRVDIISETNGTLDTGVKFTIQGDALQKENIQSKMLKYVPNQEPLRF